MSWLRDTFSKIGLCESTEDLEQKPELIEQLISASIHKHGSPVDSGYKERMELALSQATSYSLSRLIDEDVSVCLDIRLSNLASDFWGYRDIYSIFYGADDGNVLTLFDNGSTRPHGFLDPSITDYSGSCVNDVASQILDRNKEASLIVGLTRYNAATKTNTFRLEDGERNDRLFRRNPNLLHRPVFAITPPTQQPQEPS